MISQICAFFLLFTKETILIPTIFLGYFFYSRSIFFKALALLLFSIIVAAFLKSLFKIPLLPHLGGAWSLPNGHMFCATTFWGFIALKLNNKPLRFLIAVLLSGIGFSLVYFNYHIVIDVLAALFFAFTLFTSYSILLKIKSIDQSKAVLSFIMLALSAGLVYVTPSFKPIFNISLGALTGLTIGSFLAELRLFKKEISPILEMILFFTGIAFFYLIAPFLPVLITHNQFLLCFLLGWWFMVGAKVLNLAIKR